MSFNKKHNGSTQHDIIWADYNYIIKDGCYDDSHLGGHFPSAISLAFCVLMTSNLLDCNSEREGVGREGGVEERGGGGRGREGGKSGRERGGGGREGGGREGGIRLGSKQGEGTQNDRN